ncbi:hypothetical protein HYALB_00005701 [Hymenoscyphus albidus]|uniref:Uncharacterized protein n=1 Tax=Hymenoscyphus albidus TaxID=595503 RepID=A0A9N9LIX4_9HELO|nr:hypothetical protein HYALB_00005701 [Hymenoscyphus albidus]
MASSGPALATIYAIPVVPTLATTEVNAIPTAIVAATGVPSAPRNTVTYGSPASSTSTTKAAPASSSASTLPIGAKIAIGISIPLFFLALIFGLFLMFRRRKQKILGPSKEPEYDLTFSPAPTHTTFMDKDKERLAGHVDSRAETLNNSRMASRLDSRSNSRMGSHHTESRSGSRQESHLESRIGSPHSFYNPNMSPPPSQQSHYIAELPSLGLKSPTENRYQTYPIHELGPGKENGAADDESLADSMNGPIVYEIVELPDTSRRSIKNWHRNPSNASTRSRPTIRDVGERRTTVPVPPVPEDDAGEWSWLQPTTPEATKASFI